MNPISTTTILANRGPRPNLDRSSPPPVVTDIEPDGNLQPRHATTIFLTGKECPFRCLMCDLWKHTHPEPTPTGSLVHQWHAVLPQIEHREIVKLYNASNFFDPKAVPLGDLWELATQTRAFQRVVVENHPKLLNQTIFEFNDITQGKLEVAMGLETSDSVILKWLNKQMTVDDYNEACSKLHSSKVGIRTFILLPAPGVPPATMTEHTVASVRHALNAGSDVVSLIPLRLGNGTMDRLVSSGDVHLPTLEIIEDTFLRSLELRRERHQRVFLDMWELETSSIDPSRRDRLQQLNLTQTL